MWKSVTQTFGGLLLRNFLVRTDITVLLAVALWSTSGMGPDLADASFLGAATPVGFTAIQNVPNPVVESWSDGEDNPIVLREKAKAKLHGHNLSIRAAIRVTQLVKREPDGGGRDNTSYRYQTWAKELRVSRDGLRHTTTADSQGGR